MLVAIQHPYLGPQKTRLLDDVAASATSSSVENNDGLTANKYVVFGKPGQERSEIVLLTSSTGNTTIGHTTGPVFGHAARTPIYEIKFNQAKIYRSSSQTGTYTLVDTVDLNIDEGETIYDDTDGTTSSWYKVRYYNSNNTKISEYSDAVQGVGYTSNSLRALTDDILEEFGDPETQEVSRRRVRKLLRNAVRKLSIHLIKTYPTYLRAYTTDDLTSGTNTYDLPARFLGFIRVDLNYTGTTATDAYKVQRFESEADGFPDTTYYQEDPRIAIRGTQYVVRPTPTGTGKAFIWFWQYPSEMTDETDEHGLPYGANEVLVDFCLWKLWREKDRSGRKGSEYKSDFEDDLEEWIEFVGQQAQTISPGKIQVSFGSDLYED